MDRDGIPAVACDRLEHGIGRFRPYEGLWVIIVSLDEGRDIMDAVMDAALDLLIGEHSEPAFDLVQPGGAGRGRGSRVSHALTGGALCVA